jgi:putative endonuclease
MHNYYVYILTSNGDKVMYIGVTNDLERRLYEHKKGLIKGFTKRYNVDRLVYFEQTTDVKSAIAREKDLKGWKRERKNELVQKHSPTWKDFSSGWRSFATLRMTGI